MVKPRNRLLPFFGLLVLLLGGWFVYASFSKQDAPSLVERQPAGAPPLVANAPVDRDAPREDLLKVMSDVQGMADSVGSLQGVVESLQARNAEQAALIEKLVSQKNEIPSSLPAMSRFPSPESLARPKSDPGATGGDASITPPASLNTDRSVPSTVGSSLLPAIRDLQTAVTGGQRAPSSAPTGAGIVWLQPMDAGLVDGRTGQQRTNQRVAHSTSATPDLLLDQTASRLARVEKDLTGSQRINIDPKYTIPHGSVIADSRSVTALVGKIPVRGQLQDPWRFRISTGANIIMPNNHQLPGLERTIVEGTAIGDLNLSCVTGRIDVATFVFRDGRIVTQKAKNQNDGLGYITDRHGNPCIPGTLITNAPQAIAQLSAVGALEGLANAAVANETTNVLNSAGGISSSVTGDPYRAAGFSALSGGASEAKKWFIDRMGQFFDVIYVPANQRVDILISEAIHLDYNHEGRMVRYEDASENGFMD